MGRLERRLEDLEARGSKARASEEERVSREALRRVSDEDLRLVHAFLERAAEAVVVGEPTEEEEAAILRYEGIKDEVRREHAVGPPTEGRA